MLLANLSYIGELLTKKLKGFVKLIRQVHLWTRDQLIFVHLLEEGRIVFQDALLKQNIKE